MYYIYTLKCSDNNLYNGCASDLKERINRHQNKQVPATAKRLPIKLVSYTVILDKHKAFAFEKYLKSGSGRAFLKKHLL
jgi:predicted GIY-YIG superfamily endonuclease